MALDGNERRELYRKMLNDPATQGETRKYSFIDWEKKLLGDEKAIGKLAQFAVNRNWAIDESDFAERYIPEFVAPPAPKAQVAPVAPPPVEEIVPPIGIAAPKRVKEPAPSVTDITRQMAFQPPVEAPVEPVQVEPEGFFEGLGTQFKRGLAQGRAIQSVNMGQLRDAAQGKNLGAIPYEQIAAANKAVKEFGQTQSDIDLATKEGIIKDAWDVVKALPGVTIESLASLGRSGLEEALVGAGTGAAAGSIIPGLGTAAGGGLGATAGMVQAGRNMEYFGTLMQELEANGVDITDARQLREGLAKYGKSADKTAITRANTIAAVESALPIAGKAAGALAGRVGSKVAQKPLQAVGKALTYEPIAGPLGGATGELAAQIASGQEIDPQAIALETGGEGAATVAAIARAIKGEKKITDKVIGKIDKQNKIAQAMEEAVKANPEAAGQIRQQYQKRINEAAPTDEEVLSAYESLSVLPETEEKNAIRENLEGYMAERGIAPQAEAVTAEEVQGTGRRIFADSLEEVPAEYRDRVMEVTTGPLARFGVGKKQYSYVIPTETIDITAPEAVTEEDIAEEIPFEEVPTEELTPEEEDEALAAFGREVEGIEEAAPVAPAEEEINVVEPDSELFQKILDNGEQVVSRLDAEKRIGDGERLFGFNEQDDSLVELSLKNLGAFPVDTIIAVRPEVIEEAPEVAPEVVSAAPVEEAAPITSAALPKELLGKTTISSTGFGGDREHTTGKVSLEDLKVLDVGIETARQTLETDKSFKPSKEPIVVGVDVNTGEKQLLDGYHRYLIKNGKGEVAAKFIPMRNGEIISFEEAKVPAAPAPKGRKKAASVTPAPVAPEKEEGKRAEAKEEKGRVPKEPTKKGVRFEKGKKLTEEEKKEVYKNLKDSYKEMKRPYTIETRVSQYTGRDYEARVWLENASDYMQTSDVTGRKLRYYIFLPDGTLAHPTEIFPNISPSEMTRVQRNVEYNERQANEKMDDITSQLKKSGEIDKVVKAIETALNNGAEFVKEYDSGDVGQKNPLVMLRFPNGRKWGVPQYVINTQDSILGFTQKDVVKDNLGESREKIFDTNYQPDWEQFYNNNKQAKAQPEAATSFTSSQSSEAATAFDKAKTSKGFDKKYGKGAYKALSDITKNFEDIMDKVSEKIKQDCIV